MLMIKRALCAPIVAVLALPALNTVPVSALAALEEIVVTTRKREENLQDVPIAVQAITADQIERQGIKNLTDVAKLSPSVQFDTSFGPQDTRITIRGLSNTRGRSNVAFLVDGIDVTTENVISAGSGLLANRRLLNDVERIEVVKGPQSALYGRAAFSGAISYVTKEPGEKLAGKVGLDIAENGYYQLDAAVGGPVPGLEEVLGLRLNGVYWSDDGYYSNSVSGNGVGGGDGFGMALTGVYTPTDTIKIKTRVEYSDDKLNPTPVVRINGDTQVNYPKNAIVPPANLGTSSAFNGNSLGLVDHGVFCPEGVPVDESAGPGFCLPKSYGSASGKEVALSENPRTGGEYDGTTIDVLRATMMVSWDAGPGAISSYTGYTDSHSTQFYDQEYQARGRPDELLAHMETNNFQDTTQFSQELQLQSSWDAPVQLTLGGLYWHEERDLIDNDSIIACLPVTKSASGEILTDIEGVCDGNLAPVPTNTYSVVGWQPFNAQIHPKPAVAGFDGAQWNAETDHKSVYGMIEWSLTEVFKLTLEGRYVDEEFTLRRPNQASCSNLGFTVNFGGFIVPLQSEALNPGLDVNCEDIHTAMEKLNYGLDPNGPENLADLLCRSRDPITGELDPNGTPLEGCVLDATLDWAFIQGTERSKFFTPKITVDWMPTDDALIYFSWAQAQKPSGINQLGGGGSPSTIEDERFASEKMTAYEFGAKSSWEAAGFLQVNGAVFFQDYTDKQVSTQELVDDRLRPKVLNASAAEVWGLELELVWQPEMIDGLLLSAGYTHLDTEYIDFFDDTALLYRPAATNSCEVVQKGDSYFCRMDLSGHSLERTPDNSFVGVMNVQRPFMENDFDWFLELNASYQDERFVDADNFVKWDDFWLVDVRLGLASEQWNFMIYVDNALDDDTLKSGGSGPDFGQQVEELGFTAGLGVQQFFGPLPNPRTLGARLTMRF
ncbi:MAG: TonB-dependent receptor [Gammaproteobacteria bacterium]|jgi:outer membrane receptor protein involved in Fe transport|nr:TonB-dependent receptor [Gammaproteobacteria bacterium]